MQFSSMNTMSEERTELILPMFPSGEIAHGHPPQVGPQVHTYIGEHLEPRRRLEPVGDMVADDLEQDAGRHCDTVPQAVLWRDGFLIENR